MPIFKNKIAAMQKLEAVSTLKRLQNRYRLVVMNDDTYEEVVTFKLSRLSVYIMLSSIFVLLVGLTVALIVFTPLKYYIPGFNDMNGGSGYRQMKYKVDAMDKQIQYLEQYNDKIIKVLQGGTAVSFDTTQLSLPADEISND
jgi:hypothetical protein